MSEWDRRELTEVVYAIQASLKSGTIPSSHWEPLVRICGEAKQASRRFDLDSSAVREIKDHLCDQCRRTGVFGCGETSNWAHHCALLQSAG